MRVGSLARIPTLTATFVVTVAGLAAIAAPAHADIDYNDSRWDTTPGYICKGGVQKQGHHDIFYNVEGKDCAVVNKAPKTGTLTKTFMIKEPEDQQGIKWLCQTYKGDSGKVSLPDKVTGYACLGSLPGSQRSDYPEQ